MLLIISRDSFSSEIKKIVLVSGENTQVDKIPFKVLRYMFLGIYLPHKGGKISPLINKSDPDLYKIFLKRVIAMSSRNYDKKLLSRYYGEGVDMLPVYKEEEKLIESLKENKGTVSFFWADHARAIPDIKIIQELWRGTVD